VRSDVIHGCLHGRFVGLSRSVRSEWPVQTVAHIHMLERCMVLKVLLHFSHLVRGCHMLIRTDSVSAAAYVNRQRAVGSSEPAQLESPAHPLIQKVGAGLVSRGGPCQDECRFTFQHLPD